MSIEDNKEFLRTAQPFSGARAIICIWCGEAVLYADSKTPPEYLTRHMKEHDLSCPKHPLTVEIERLKEIVSKAHKWSYPGLAIKESTLLNHIYKITGD